MPTLVWRFPPKNGPDDSGGDRGASSGKGEAAVLDPVVSAAPAVPDSRVPAPTGTGPADPSGEALLSVSSEPHDTGEKGEKRKLTSHANTARRNPMADQRPTASTLRASTHPKSNNLLQTMMGRQSLLFKRPAKAAILFVFVYYDTVLSYQSAMNAVQTESDEHTARTGTIHLATADEHTKKPLNPDSICFITAEFADSIEDADTLAVVDEPMRRDPPRHFVFTNLPSLQADGWEKIVLTDTDVPFRRQITKSRWPKFQGWRHARVKERCQIIFYGDAYFYNPTNETLWTLMAQQIQDSDVGLMQQKQPGRREIDGPVRELLGAVQVHKLSAEAADITIAWLRNRTDYRERTPVYKNALFGYNPASKRFQNTVFEFWNEYSKEEGSWRDQPQWAYYLSRHGMVPLDFPYTPPMAKAGRKGHNGHTYVDKQ